MSGPTMETIPPDGIEYWARLSAFINNNPVHERDRFFMAMLKPLGIEKGKPFNPDARQRAILEEAAKVGDAMARTLLFHAEKRIQQCHATAFSGTHWNWVVLWLPTRKPPPTASSTNGCTTSTARSTCRLPSGENGRPRRDLYPSLHRQGRQPLRRQQVVPLARPGERAGVEPSGR